MGKSEILPAILACKEWEEVKEICRDPDKVLLNEEDGILKVTDDLAECSTITNNGHSHAAFDRWQETLIALFLTEDSFTGGNNAYEIDKGKSLNKVGFSILMEICRETDEDSFVHKFAELEKAAQIQ